MRLVVAAGWYWWLSGHKAEAHELTMAAVSLPGEVDDQVRATAYAFVMQFVSSGRGDQNQAAEWIHQAYELSRGGQGRHPALRFITLWEHMFRQPDAGVRAFDPLLADEDPWVRALARLQLAKMWMTLGHDGRDTDAYLETALTEFRALGERWGISFALMELANRIAMHGEFARACDYLDQAIAIVTEVGALEDVMPMRARQAQLYWLAGDEAASASALADARRYARHVAWPNALAELALSESELARWRGDTEQARRHLETATSLLGDDAKRAGDRTIFEHLLGSLSDDLDEARTHLAAALAAAAELGHAPAIAGVLVGVADLALRAEQYEQAARLLAASTAVRGLPDHSQPDAARIEREARRRLGDTRFTEATREGAEAQWRTLADVTLAC